MAIVIINEKEDSFHVEIHASSCHFIYTRGLGLVH